MAFCDFVVKYNPETDSVETLTERILYSIWIKRIKANKPAVIYLGGDSGEGKSLGALRLIQLLLKIQGLDLKDYLSDINVYNPSQYPEKLDRILFDKTLKKLNIICVHEAREVVKAKLWQSFVTQAVADVNAMSRSIKRLIFIIISQFIRDITPDVRYTINYYCMVRRPKQKRSRLYIHVMWKDDRDLEKPKLRKRRLSGYLVDPEGRYTRFVPEYLELRMPDKEIVKEFEKQDREAKGVIIRNKLNRLIKEINRENQIDTKIPAMVQYYTNNLDNLKLIGIRKRGTWRVRPEFKKMHDLNPNEAREFQEQLNKVLKEKGVMDGA